MAVAIHSGGSTHPIRGVYIRDSEGLRAAAVARIRNAANALKLLFGSLSAALDTANVAGRINSSASVAITTQAATVAPTGGQEPYSYTWSLVSSSGGTWIANSPSSASTTFTGGNCGPGSSLTADWHCVVTDAAGNTVTTGAVTATVSNISTGGTGPLP